VESEERQMKQGLISYIKRKKPKKSPFRMRRFLNREKRRENGD
jgi:hypothetical protein